jgi:hypothetical protein
MKSILKVILVLCLITPVTAEDVVRFSVDYGNNNKIEISTEKWLCSEGARFATWISSDKKTYGCWKFIRADHIQATFLDGDFAIFSINRLVKIDSI